MRGIKVADMRTTFLLLIETQQYNRISSVIDQSIPTFNSADDWNTLFELLYRIPENVRMESIPLALHFARTLSQTYQVKELFAFCDLVLEGHGLAQVAEIEVVRGMALHILHKYQEALDCIEPAIKYLQGEALGFAYSKLGLVLFALEKPWQQAFLQARLYLTDLELGKTLLNEGFCFAESHQIVQAQQVWQEALVHLYGSPRLQAWVRYNLGIMAVRDLESEAERHFLEAQRLTKNAKAVSMRASVLNGLAASRRVLGEWSRVETAYREAIRVAQDSHDRKEAYLGLARTLRLAGRAGEALETLEFALQDQTINHDQIQVSRAKAFLVLNQNNLARDALNRVGKLVSVSDQWLYNIAQAELFRRDGNLENAVNILEGLPIHTLHAREEARSFPDLMLLLKAAGKPFPKPLEYTQGITVRVVAQGVLSVRVNDRPVAIAPTGRAGELLVYLLEQNGAATLDMISDAMFSSDGIPEREMVRRLTWRLVKNLRQAFGWKNSVVSLRAAYQLDPNATWQYDIKEARATRTFQGEFLKGVYSNWALETGRELAGIRGERRKNLELN